MRSLSRIAHRVGMGRILSLILMLDFVLLRIWDPLPLIALRHNAFDLFQTIVPRVSPIKPVLIVDIDEPSLKALGQWPWPRSVVADLVTKIAKAGAVAIGFDVIFPEADRLSPNIIAETVRGLDGDTREKLLRLPNNDEILAQAIEGARVVLGQSGFRDRASSDDADALVQTGFALLGEDPRPYLITFPHLLPNIPILEAAAKGRGLLTIRPERDGIVRRVPMLMMAGGVMVPSLALEMLRVVTASEAILVKAERDGIRSVGVRGLEIPTDRRGQLWLHFSDHDPAKFVSAKEILEDVLPIGRFSGKLVLIGTSAIGLLDLKTTPVHPAMPGVEVHAQVLESVLARAVLTSSSRTTLVELVLATLLSLALIALAPILPAGALFAIGVVVAGSLIGLSWYSFAAHKLLLDYTFPLLASFSIYFTLVFTNYLRASADRRRIRSAFGQYLSPALVEELAQSPHKLTLGGEERELTLMFSDVRGFTRISEQFKTDPQGLTALMNRMLTPLTNVIIEHKGTIDKYMGDAIMAFWNAPLHDPLHPVSACEAALAMQHSLASLNEEREREAIKAGRPFIPMKVGIGLNTGRCVVGNMGSDLHFNYSVLGDAVNLAARLEAQSKYYCVPIVIGMKTAEAVADRFAVLQLDRLLVKGKSDPENVFTILGGKSVAEAETFQRLRHLNNAMFCSYASRDWTKALELLILCRDAGKPFGLDELYSLYVSRIRALIAVPPPAHWDGVHVAESK